MQFRGMTKDYIKVLRGRKRPPWAPIQRDILTMPGRPGGFLQGTQTGIRQLSVPIYIEGENFSDLQKVKEDLAAWLITGKEEELIFSDEPDRVYYAMIDSSCDLDELVNYGQGVLTFICPDPYKYGPEKITEFIDSQSFYVDGSTETNPIITVNVQSDTTFVAVGNGDKLNMIGMYAEVGQESIIREERKLWNEMGNLTGWSDTASIEEGKNLGTMKTTGYSFYTDDYGTDAAWHGPAKKIAIGTTIQDFQVDALVHQSSTSGKTGSIEIALLDANNQFVGKMLLSKRSTSSPANWVRMRAGTVSNGHDIMNTRGANDWTWANFDGLIRISRVGNVWTAYACLIDENGVQHTRFSPDPWIDTYSIATAPIAQIQVQLWQYGTTPTTQQYIADIKAYQINSPTDSQIPIIVRAGDQVIFDHQNDKILLNGQPILKEKAFIGEYFPLRPGMNTVVAEPAEAISKTEVRWKPKWL